MAGNTGNGTHPVGPIIGQFAFTTLTVAARIIIFVVLLVVPAVAGSLLFPAEGTLPNTVCKALVGAMCYGLLFGAMAFAAGKAAALVSGGRFGGISADLAFVVCAALAFVYVMAAG